MGRPRARGTITRCGARNECGAALFLTFLMMLVLSGLALAVGVFSQHSHAVGKAQRLDRQAFYVAEAGLARARQQMAVGTWSAATCPSASPCAESFPDTDPVGQYQVTITGSGPYTITSDGYVPNATTWVARRQVSASNVSTYTNLSRNPNVVGLASSSNGSNTPDQAKDGQTNTNWKADTNGSGSWLAMDFQAATSLDQTSIKEDNNIDGLTIEWSDDNASWTAASGLSVVESPSKTWTATFTLTAHRYVRAQFTSVPSNKKASVSEMDTYNTASSTVSLTSGTIATQW